MSIGDGVSFSILPEADAIHDDERERSRSTAFLSIMMSH
jgi:hypothetical protein